ncbi:hypothetical protein ABC304_10100 [Microbacterium sp. 1P10UB]|uniref:hypothetical protein n=1 Tax=unclassified Microbacterium TaxID=2609290 RepID=UPI00399F0818
MTSSPPTPSPKSESQISVWYFVGATFVLAAPVIFLPDADFWVRIVSIALGLVLVVAGGFQLRRELTARRDRRAGPPSSA